MSGHTSEMKRSDNSKSYSGVMGDIKTFLLISPMNKIQSLGLLRVRRCNSGVKFKQGDEVAT